jgi:hypothetical protein
VRVPGSGGDLTLHLQPCTWLALEGATATPRDKVRVRVIAEAVTDPLLRAFDRHAHAAEFEATDPSELLFAPGTVLELTPVRDGKPGTAHRVVVGNESPQTVTLR